MEVGRACRREELTVVTFVQALRKVGRGRYAAPPGAAFPHSETDDLTDFIARLRSRGMTRLSVGHEIRFAALLARLGEDGCNLSDRSLLADLLVPILAISEDEEKIVRAEIAVWPAGAGASPSPGAEKTTIRRMVARSGRRWLIGLAAVVAFLMAVLAAWIFDLLRFRTWLSSSAVTEPTRPSEPVADAFDFAYAINVQLSADWAGVVNALFSGLIVSAPVLLAVAVLLRQREDLKESLVRQVGKAAFFGNVPLPRSGQSIMDQADAQTVFRSLREWQHLKNMPSQDLDVPATVRSMSRNLGRPEWHYGNRRERPAYVFVVDRSSSADHLSLIVAAVEDRLKIAGVLYERYDFRGDPRQLWSQNGLARQAPPERLANVAARHRGERLLLLSDGEALNGRPWGEVIDALAMFSHSVMLHPVQEKRWGDRERELMDAGMLIVPADVVGFERAALVFGEDTNDSNAKFSAVLKEGEDPFLADLRHNRGHYLSDIAIGEAAAGRLVRRLRGYLLGHDLYPTFVAVAAFPKIDPAITLYLARSIRGAPLGMAETGVLARLPWLRAGRVPDWLRKALLESLPKDEAERIRSVFTEIVGGIRADSTLPSPESVHAAAESARKKMEIAYVPHFIDRFWGRTDSLGFGEHIFIGFMKREKLTIDAPKNMRLPWWQSLDAYDLAAVVLGLLGAAAAYWFQNAIVGLLKALIEVGEGGLPIFVGAITCLEVAIFAMLATKFGVPGFRWLIVPLSPAANRILWIGVPATLSILIGFAVDSKAGITALFASVLASVLFSKTLQGHLDSIQNLRIELRQTKSIEIPVGLFPVVVDGLSHAALLSLTLLFIDPGFIHGDSKLIYVGALFEVFIFSIVYNRLIRFLPDKMRGSTYISLVKTYSSAIIIVAFWLSVSYGQLRLPLFNSILMAVSTYFVFYFVFVVRFPSGSNSSFYSFISITYRYWISIFLFVFIFYDIFAERDFSDSLVLADSLSSKFGSQRYILILSVSIALYIFLVFQQLIYARGRRLKGYVYNADIYRFISVNLSIFPLVISVGMINVEWLPIGDIIGGPILLVCWCIAAQILCWSVYYYVGLGAVHRRASASPPIEAFSILDSNEPIEGEVVPPDANASEFGTNTRGSEIPKRAAVLAGVVPGLVGLLLVGVLPSTPVTNWISSILGETNFWPTTPYAAAQYVISNFLPVPLFTALVIATIGRREIENKTILNYSLVSVTSNYYKHFLILSFFVVSYDYFQSFYDVGTFTGEYAGNISDFILSNLALYGLHAVGVTACCFVLIFFFMRESAGFSTANAAIETTIIASVAGASSYIFAMLRIKYEFSTSLKSGSEFLFLVTGLNISAAILTHLILRAARRSFEPSSRNRKPPVNAV
jgi:hypothetical protein